MSNSKFMDLVLKMKGQGLNMFAIHLGDIDGLTKRDISTYRRILEDIQENIGNKLKHLDEYTS